MKYVSQYGHAATQTASAYRAGKRVCNEEIARSPMLSQPRASTSMAALVAPTSYVKPAPSGDLHAATLRSGTEYAAFRALAYHFGVEEVIACGGGNANQLPNVASNQPMLRYPSYTALSVKVAVAGSSHSNQ